MGEVDIKDVWRLLLKETFLGFLQGIAVAVVPPGTQPSCAGDVPLACAGRSSASKSAATITSRSFEPAVSINHRLSVT